MLDVFLLLTVAGGLCNEAQARATGSDRMVRTLESPDDERGGRGHDRDGRLSVLDRQLNGDPQTLPCGRRFCDVLSNLLGRLEQVSAHANRSMAKQHTRPRGPIFGARAEEAPTSPPVARR